MERNEYGGLIARWKVDLIRARAKRLYFRADEIDDLEQIIVQELLKTDFDPDLAGGSSERTFVIAVIDRQLLKVKRDRGRDKRRVNFESASLDAGDVLTEKTFFALARPEKHELRVDVHQALVGLTPAERALCEALGQGHSQAEIARATGRSKAAICGEVKRLRAKFRKWGLGEYVGREEDESSTERRAVDG